MAYSDDAASSAPTETVEGKIASTDATPQSAAPAPLMVPAAPAARGGENAPAESRNEGVQTYAAQPGAAPLDAADKDEALPVRVVTGDAATRFEQILAEQRIELLQRDLPTAVEESLAEAAGDEDSTEEVVLVEGSREQLDAVLLAIAANRPEEPTDRARFAVPERRGGAARGFAWRLAKRGEAEEVKNDAKRAAALATDAAEATVTLQGEAGEPAATEPAARVRMLFLLQRETAVGETR